MLAVVTAAVAVPAIMAVAVFLLLLDSFVRLVALFAPMTLLRALVALERVSLELATLSREIASAYGLCSTSLRRTSLACIIVTGGGEVIGSLFENETKVLRADRRSKRSDDIAGTRHKGCKGRQPVVLKYGKSCKQFGHTNKYQVDV